MLALITLVYWAASKLAPTGFRPVILLENTVFSVAPETICLRLRRGLANGVRDPRRSAFAQMAAPAYFVLPGFSPLGSGCNRLQGKGSWQRLRRRRRKLAFSHGRRSCVGATWVRRLKLGATPRRYNVGRTKPSGLCRLCLVPQENRCRNTRPAQHPDAAGGRYVRALLERKENRRQRQGATARALGRLSASLYVCLAQCFGGAGPPGLDADACVDRLGRRRRFGERSARRRCDLPGVAEEG